MTRASTTPWRKFPAERKEVNMTKLAVMILAILALSAIPVAQATTIIPKAYCQSVTHYPDTGTTVSVDEVVGPPIAGQGRTSHLTATITESTIMGAMQEGVYKVKLVPHKPHTYGGATVYKGKDFELVIQTDTLPIEGKFRASVTAELANGRRMVEELLCNPIR
jgi:hypothetical protein